MDKQSKTLSENLNMVEGVYDGAVGCFTPTETTDYAQLLVDYCRQHDIDINQYSDGDYQSAVLILRDFSRGAERISFWIEV